MNERKLRRFCTAMILFAMLTRLLGGVPYLLIRADDGVEVNGIAVSIPGLRQEE